MTVLKISFRKAVFARKVCIYCFSFNGFKTTMQSIDKIENTKKKKKEKKTEKAMGRKWQLRLKSQNFVFSWEMKLF